MEAKILISGIVAVIIGYVLYRKFWEFQQKGNIEQEFHDILTKDEYKVKGKHE